MAVFFVSITYFFNLLVQIFCNMNYLVPLATTS